MRQICAGSAAGAAASAEQVAWARTGSLFTRDFEDQVAGLTRVTDKTTVNRLFEISWVTVGRIAARVVGEKLDPKRLEGLSFIGIDEFSTDGSPAVRLGPGTKILV